MNKEYKTFEELKKELGDKFEEYMYKANIELLDKVNQLETNRDEAIEKVLKIVCYIEHNLDKYQEIGLEEHFKSALRKTEELKEILFLERGKE